MKKTKKSKIFRIKLFRKAYIFQDWRYIGWYQWKEKRNDRELGHKLDPEVFE